MESVPRRAHRSLLFVVFLVCGVSLPSLSGLLVLPFSLIIPANMVLIYMIGLAAVFLISSLLFHRSMRFKKYRGVLFAFFVASFAILVDLLINIGGTSISAIASDMLLSALLIVSSIIVLTKASAGSLTSIFLRKGRIKFGLFIGVVGVLFFALTSFPAATYLFQARNLSIDRTINWGPWLLTIVMANGVREELLYRGLFLKKFEPLFGSRVSNILQAVIFSLSHSVAGRGTETYTAFTAMFVLITFLLGLAFGYTMQKTDSLLGSVLLHAGSDIPIFMAIFSNLA